MDSSRTEPQNAIRAEFRDLDELVAALRRGEGYCEFRRVFLPKIRTYLRRRGVSGSEAEDLAESCLTDIALKVPRDQPGGPTFKASVARSVERVALEWVRALVRNRALLQELSLELRRQTTVDWGRGEESLAERPILCVAVVRDAMLQLSDEDRTIVESRQGDLPVQFNELAAAFGISPGAARVRYHRALNHLKLLVSSDPRLARVLARTRVDTLGETVRWEEAYIGSLDRRTRTIQ